MCTAAQRLVRLACVPDPLGDVRVEERLVGQAEADLHGSSLRLVVRSRLHRAVEPGERCRRQVQAPEPYLADVGRVA